ncbi:hypothetical protein ACS5PK_10200 [Roseateles sp. DB2]|uniref:hypothetical protein n=1 Tax=Roseateles sp. DB2 TaxID=3453717 RepID=UPI003EE94727
MYIQSPDERAYQIAGLPSGNATFVGREALLNDLDRWFEDHHNRFMQVTADGGTGKTALVHHWLSHGRCFQISGAQRPPTIAVHSFYLQAKSGRTSVEECLENLFIGVCGKGQASPRSSDQLVASIADACASGPTLLVLDGFETQQNRDGLIEAEYLLLAELFLRLEEITTCKILVTSRRRIVESGIPTTYSPSLVELPGLERPDLCGLFEQAFPGADPGAIHGKISACFPERTPALVAVLALNALSETGSADALHEVIPSPRDVELRNADGVPTIVPQLVARSYEKQPEDGQFILRLVALSDAEVGVGLGSEIAAKLGRRWSQAEYDRLSKMRLVIARYTGPDLTGLDMHPRVRDSLSSLAKQLNEADFNAIGRSLAEVWEARARACGPNDRKRALEDMLKAIVYRLRIGDLQHALVNNYLDFFSGEPNPARPKEPPEWRSVRKDLAYTLEDRALDTLEDALVKELHKPLREEEAILYREALNGLKRRQLYVRRSIGLIDKADVLGMSLAGDEATAQPPLEGAMTAQTVLTKLIRGEVNNTAKDASGAAYWSAKAERLAGLAAPSLGTFPTIRSLVYKGAYLHRLDKNEEALEVFETACSLQKKLHEDRPDTPSCLIGLNAFLFLWFLIETGRFERAQELVGEVHGVLAFMDRSPALAGQTQQWLLMLVIPEAWLLQERALAAVEQGRHTDAQTWMVESERLIWKLKDEDRKNRWAIPYDMRSVFVRTSLRSRIIQKQIDVAIKELRHQIKVYKLSKAFLFAADCQGDLLRFYASAHRFSDGTWTRPNPSVALAAAHELADLSTKYPFVQQNWRRMAPLQHIRLNPLS